MSRDPSLMGEPGANVRSLLVDNIGALATNDEGTGTGPIGLLRDAAMVVDHAEQVDSIGWRTPRQSALADCQPGDQ